MLCHFIVTLLFTYLSFTFYLFASYYDEHIVTPIYETELEKISKKLLLKEENKLDIMNAVYLRNTVTIGYYIILKDIQSITQALIKELEKVKYDA
jgi:hypothetical protein